MGYRYARRTERERPISWSLEQVAAECEGRFACADYTVTRDEESKTVWVSSDGGKLKVAVQPATVERRGLERTLEHVEEQLRASALV